MLQPIFKYLASGAILVLALVVAQSAAASVQTPVPELGGELRLSTQVLAGGGARAVSVGSGVTFALTGTLAQSTAGPSPTAIGGNFALRGGFYSAGAPLGDAIFRDGFEN